MRCLLPILVGFLVWSTPPAAQVEREEAGGALVRFLEQNLSGDNRAVRVRGLDGALSSRATIEELTVSDDDGVWLTIRRAELDWNRLALVQRRFSVNTLTADEIIIDRKPIASAEPNALPTPEARSIRVPELPVSIELDKIGVDKLILGEDVFGLQAELMLGGTLTLSDGKLATDLAVSRLDREGDEFILVANVENESGLIALDLTLREGPDGLISTALQIPGRPSLSMTAEGDGHVDDFTADLSLASDEVERLGGQVRLRAADNDGSQGIAFAADLSGDATPLFAQEYREFFGTSLRLNVDGLRTPDGQFAVSDLSIETDALSLAGNMTVGSEGGIDLLDMRGQIRPPDGADVTLPLGEPATTLGAATIAVQAITDGTWSLELAAERLSRPDVTLGRTRVTAKGTRGQNGQRLEGDLAAEFIAMTFADRALADALGGAARVDGTFAVRNDGTLRFTGLTLEGDDYSATVDAIIDGLQSGFEMDGSMKATAQDLSRFAKLAGQDIAGVAQLDLVGRGAPLGGSFDFDLDLSGVNLKTGFSQIDPLLAGPSTLELSAERGPNGLLVERLELGASGIAADASGRLTSGAGTFRIEATLPDVSLAAPVVSGSARLVGDIAFDADGLMTDVRITGPQSLRATLVTGTQNDTDELQLSLNLSEDRGGPISTLLKMPDQPPLALSVLGKGPLRDFAAEITVASDGTKRVSGDVTLRDTPALDGDIQAGSDDPKDLAFTADLQGDVTPFLQPRFRAFFGQDTSVSLAGRRREDGRLILGRIDAQSDALSVDGAMNLAADGTVARARLNARIEPVSGKAVVLPIPGSRTAIGAAYATVTFDGAAGGAWSADLNATRLAHPAMRMNQIELSASGTADPGMISNLQGQMRADLNGIGFTDPGLSQAVGDSIALRGLFNLTDGTVATLRDMVLEGLNYRVDANLDVTGLSDSPAVQGEIKLGAADLSRFSELTGREIGGSANVVTRGSASMSGEHFDLDLDLRAVDLRSGIAAADVLLSGETTLSLSAKRDQDGLAIDTLDLNATGLRADAKGTLRRIDSEMTIDAVLPELNRIVPELRGPLTLKADLAQEGTIWGGDIALTGPQSSFARLNGSLTPKGDAKLDFDAEFNGIERFLPSFPGAITANGEASRNDAQWDIDVKASGPAGITTTVTGRFDETSGTADLAASGQVALAAVNRFIRPNSISGTGQFDLSLKGRPALRNIAGSVSTSGSRVVFPGLAQTIDNLGARIDLSGGNAQVNATGTIAAGGGFSVSGPVSLTPPFNANLSANLNRIVLTDNLSYDTSASGTLSFAGALTGGGELSGQVEFGETNINLNQASGSVGAAPIPQITHVGEPASVRLTRDRAGLLKSGSDGGGPVFGLNLNLIARNRVFARGRGLQAEMGGNIVVRGTTASVVPSGQIELIRGTFDILGSRLNLTQGRVTLQGQLQPYVEFVTETSTSEGQATLRIAGPLKAPEITVESSPSRPPEEALAMILFGSSFSELSPFRLAQVAASLARLSGRTGDGKAQESLGVETLDLGVDESGAGRVGIGTYLSDNVYSDVTVNTEGETEIQLNLDVTNDLTIRGSVDNNGQTGVGIFFERDY